MMRTEDDCRSALTWMILPVGRTWYRAVSKAFEDFGMSFSTAAPIRAIATLGDGIHQNAVSEAIGVGAAAMARSIDQLASLVLVACRVEPGARRGRRLYLARQGLMVAKELDVAAADILQRALASVTDADGRAAVRALRSLKHAAEEMLRNERHD